MASVDSGCLGVHDLVAQWVVQQPETCAVRESFTGRTLTYQELWDQTGQLAAILTDLGVRRGDLVAVDLNPSVDLTVAFLGIMRAGAAYLPLDNHAPSDRLIAILQEAGPKLAICAKTSETDGWRQLPSNLKRISLSGTVATAGTVPPKVVAGGDDPIYVAYTSGSTGRPKGVVVPHRAVIRLAVAPNYCTIAPGDRVANLSNPAFDATTFEVWSTLSAGGTVVAIPQATDLAMDDWVEHLIDEGITTMFLTTSLFHTVSRERPAAFRSLHNLVVGGEQLDVGAVRRVLASEPPRRLVNGYGPTEATTFAAAFECTPDNVAGVDRIPIGFALQNTTLHVVDEDLNPVEPGQIGELCIGGPGVALGYLGNPELTAEKFVIEPQSGNQVYRTGDMARQLPTGALELVGRRDRQVKLRGFRIELAEIEQAVLATGLVDAAFVEKVGEGPTAVLVGFVLPTRSVMPGPDDLSTLLAQQLPRYMIPARWVRLAQVPLGPTGKADRVQMLALLEQPEPATHDIEDSASGAVDALRKIWRDVLGVSEVSSVDNFIDLGGNSILAIQVASRANQTLAIRVDPVDVLLAESCGELSKSLSTKALPTKAVA